MITLSAISKSFGNEKILDAISLTIPQKKVSVILGPSGCGKTTLLNIISGIEKDFEGECDAAGLMLSYVFQEDRLLEWATVRENIDFVLKGRNIEDSVVNEVFDILAISPLKNRAVSTLSGGQKQRVSIARAFIYPSDVVLMDEPFKSLDLNLKTAIIRDLLSLLQRYEKTVVLVTHDPKEAALMGDTVTILTDRPSQVKHIYAVNLAKSERFLYDVATLKVEQDICSTLLQ